MHYKNRDGQIFHSKHKLSRVNPHASGAQGERQQKQGLHTVVINGFEVMQRGKGRG